MENVCAEQKYMCCVGCDLEALDLCSHYLTEAVSLPCYRAVSRTKYVLSFALLSPSIASCFVFIFVECKFV